MAIMLDLDLSAEEIAQLVSVDALAAFLHRLGYPTDKRAVIPVQAANLDGHGDIHHLELLSEDAEGFLRIVFVQLRSVTARNRNLLVQTFGKQNQDYLLILTSDFEALEFVLIEKIRQQRKGFGLDPITKPQARVFVVPRRWPQNMLRILRRLTFTARDEAGRPDAILQYAKLISVFDAAHYSGEYFQNRALFSDHYLGTRLPEDPAWTTSPNDAFQRVSLLMSHARQRLAALDKAAISQELFVPLFSALGFTVKPGQPAIDSAPQPDYCLLSPAGQRRTVALVYAWQRWLDGPDAADTAAPSANPGAAVVTLLERGDAEWVIVTNGKLWRLYSRHAHSRSTNFYEVDLEDALQATGQTDPNEAFRYWWLFFREPAFAPAAASAGAPSSDAVNLTTPPSCWLDTVAAGSHDYARAVEAQLKRRVFYEVVPQLSGGFLEDARQRLGQTSTFTADELEQVREATLTLLYRILFLLYAESRDLLPVRESAYYQISLKKLKEEIAAVAGIAESQADEKIAHHYRATHVAQQPNVAQSPPAVSQPLYDRLTTLFSVMDGGDLKLNRQYNVPVYNGGLFRSAPPDTADQREAALARFLLEHKIPDRFLASALDRLARVPDPKTFGLAFVDYKSLGVRQLGSIYEGLLEFRLKIAASDLPPVTEGGRRSSTRLSVSRGAADRTGVKKGEPYLANDNAERKASGSYYTPDHIVQYIVEHTVGPVLQQRLDALRMDFRAAEKAFHQTLSNATADPRLLWDWKLRHGQSSAKAKNPTAEEIRHYALDSTYETHRTLVDRLFNLKVLDPAMGSGHFLVEAVDYITDAILNFLNAFPDNPITAAMARTRQSILESLKDQGLETDLLLEKQLTDVHLIKRHVLKRCIYGVDLNPLATELAKVSLWLDAFTIGAPLSFLDHHVRIGNSLIGATFQDLETLTSEALFPIDYQPMLRAIHNMLLVSRLSDATAAEVHESASKYDSARAALDGYRLVLDLITARHFGHPRAPLLIKEAIELKLDSRTAFLEQLNQHDARVAREVEGLSHQRRFFHWELEFPEVFFAYRDGSQQHIEKKRDGLAGFDCIVGNPPYVRQETFKDDKAFLKSAYAPVFDAANDLYIFFIYREIMTLQAHGLMSMIVANKWLRAGYGEKLRQFLRRFATPRSIIDFGHTPIFPEADTFPCVPIFGRRLPALSTAEPPPADEIWLACSMPREDYQPHGSISDYVARRSFPLSTRLLRDDVWSLEDPRVQALMAKIRGTGVSLKEYVGSPPYRGPVSGLNEAFYIDETTRQNLIRADKRSAEIIKPLLRGRDIDRWNPRVSGMYIIFARRGLDLGQYPAIKKHLLPFRPKLEPRPADWNDQHNGPWPGRAPGDYKWYELQASPSDDAVEIMERPRIVYQVILYHCWFARTAVPLIHNDKAFALPTDDPWLLAVLNSRLMWWFLTRFLPHMKDEALTPVGFRMETVPIAAPTAAVRVEAEKLLTIAADSNGDAKDRLAAETALSDLVAEAYQLSAAEKQHLSATRPIRDPLDVQHRRLLHGADAAAAEA